MLAALMSFVVAAHPAPEWDAQLGQTWVLTEGWTSSTMVLRPNGPDLDPDDWIGLVFRANGTIGFEEVRWVDRSGGCSNAFAQFSGTWTHRGGRIELELIEETFADRYPAAMRVESLQPDRLVLQPSTRP